MANISTLLLKLIVRRLSDSEANQLHSWIESGRRRQELVDMITDPDELEREYKFRNLIDSRRAEADMKRRIALAEAPRRRRMFAVAASVAAIVGLGVWFIAQHSNPLTDSVSSGQLALVEEQSEIKPGETKALIRIADGKSIVLGEADSVATNVVSFSNLASATKAPIAKKLCLEVPRGGEFKIILEDSTEVWLNSESSLHYPDKFDSKERVVEVSGEVYFKVRKDASRPFYVVAGEQKIRVYGTTFNVRNYADDNLSYTTLETGSIALSRRDGIGGEIFLKPDHQAIFNKNESQLSMKVVDAQRISEWRHGRFVFEGQTLLNILRDLSRWYDFQFEFIDPTIGEICFFGNIPRYAEFQTAITILENCGDINFDIEGTKVTVSRL